MDSSSSASSSSSHQYKGAVSFPASSTSSVVRPRWPDLPIYESTPHYPPMESNRFASSASPYSNYGYDYATHSLAGVRGGEAGGRSIAAGEDESTEVISEKEHMFDKVVTPSDVGKLNRLVIPKQHAEKYFPLDSTSGDNSKGLLLNFEDRSGKSWRFRYSYWNSSQSYVMTKGWSRFVKEKKLDAGDIVSFHRGVSEKDRFYIDWRRRPDAPPYHHALYNTVQFQNGFALHRPIMNHPPFYTLSPPMPPPTLLNHHQHAHARGYNALTANSNSTSCSGGGGGCYGGNYGIVSPNFCQHHHHHQQQSGSVIYLGAAATGAPQQQMRGSQRISGGGIDEPMVFDSVPVVQAGGKAAGKRLRLFGVNMDCTDSQEQGNRHNNLHHLREFVLDSDRIDSSSASLGAESALQLRLSGGASSTGESVEKGKSSMSLDLDI